MGGIGVYSTGAQTLRLSHDGMSIIQDAVMRRFFATDDPEVASEATGDATIAVEVVSLDTVEVCARRRLGQ